jgi:hypothetical protein
MRASGTFEVELTPQAAEPRLAGASVGRLAIAKRFEGGLDAMSVGEMLTAVTAVKGSAVYVAVERVSGRLDGRQGAFSLHHTGVMTRGEGRLTIAIVPDSGDEQLSGISGTMTIEIEAGRHLYHLDYELPANA